LIREFNATKFEYQDDSHNWRAPGYHEIMWDGKDDDGNIIANGVYFAVIKAEYEGETIKKTMKIAKLK
jgi:flagellar hook assembly protein FlgD